MFKFLKVLIDNLSQGPSTEAFPAQESPTPARFRGRVVMDPSKCVGCGICRHVCAGRAINIQNNEDKTGYDFVVWHNTCCLCGMCRHYCPTKAISMTNDWHNTHLQGEKYTWTEHHFVPYLRCEECDEPMRLLPPELATRIYAHSPVDMTKLMRLCPTCRQKAEAARIKAHMPPVPEEEKKPKKKNDEQAKPDVEAAGKVASDTDKSKGGVDAPASE